MKRYFLMAAVVFSMSAFTATTAMAYTSNSVEVFGEKEKDGKKKKKKAKSDASESGKAGCSGKSQSGNGGCCAAKKKSS